MKVLSLSKAKTKLDAILNILERTSEAVTVTRRGKPVAVIMSKKKYDRWRETIEIISDAEFMGEIREGIRALKCSKKRHTIDELFGN